MIVVYEERQTTISEALCRRVDEINLLMRTHAGAIEVVDLSADGVLTVRFVAMCQGCPFRAVTMYGLVKPALEQLPGVTEVRAQGVRISEEAARRAAVAIGEGAAWLPLACSERDVNAG